MFARPAISLLILAVAACTARPEFETALGPEPPGNDYPELLPIGELLTIETGDPTEAAEADRALLDRADALRNRAGALGSQS